MTTSRIALAIVGLVSAGLAASPGAVAGTDSLRLSTGFERTTGDYGGDGDIDETYLPLTVSFGGSRFGARLTVPYLSISTPALPDSTDVGTDPAAGNVGRVTESGIGDVVASVTAYDVMASRRFRTTVDLTAKIKLGTADDAAGLGTGQADYTLLADVIRFLDRGLLVATAGYRVRGDTVDAPLDDGMLASVGGLCGCTERSNVGLFYDFRESSAPGDPAIREISLTASRSLGELGRLNLYVFQGLSDTSADRGVGMSIGVNLSRFLRRDRY